MSLERRLADLEARSAGAQWELPIEVRILLKAVARHRARERGEEPPAYSREELEEMYRDDLEAAGGGGIVGLLRDSGGCTSPESLDLLSSWAEDARRRLERLKDGEPLEIVYNDGEDERERRGEWP